MAPLFTLMYLNYFDIYILWGEILFAQDGRLSAHNMNVVLEILFKVSNSDVIFNSCSCNAEFENDNSLRSVNREFGWVSD